MTQVEDMIEVKEDQVTARGWCSAEYVESTTFYRAGEQNATKRVGRYDNDAQR